ncbi:MAG: LCP family protein [Sporolactobacillus sp.]
MTEEEKRQPSEPRRKRKRSHKFFISLFVLIFFLLVGAGGAYAFHLLNPRTHFSHLKTIGTTATSTKYKEKSGIFNVLLIGSDERKKDPAGHTDSIMLVHVDLTHHRYNVLSIPRDTRVYMAGHGYTKLTSVQYISQINDGTKTGILEAVKSVSQLTGVPINYYAETNYWGLESMVGALGGITMHVPFNVTLTHPWFKADKNKVIKKGEHQLNGRMVSEVVHERDSVPGTDFGRQRLQEDALIGITNKVMRPQNATRLPALSRSMSKFLISTNLSTSDMVSLGLGVKSDFHPKRQIHYHQISGKNTVMHDDVLQANNDEVVLDSKQLRAVVQKYFVN